MKTHWNCSFLLTKRHILGKLVCAAVTSLSETVSATAAGPQTVGLIIQPSILLTTYPIQRQWSHMTRGGYSLCICHT